MQWGPFGIGESMADRLDLAFTLREIAPDTVPINLLDPVEGTPMGHNKVLTEEEVRRIIGVFKYILPNQMIRLAAGRDYLEDTGLRCFSIRLQCGDHGRFADGHGNVRRR